MQKRILIFLYSWVRRNRNPKFLYGKGLWCQTIKRADGPPVLIRRMFLISRGDLVNINASSLHHLLLRLLFASQETYRKESMSFNRLWNSDRHHLRYIVIGNAVRFGA